MAAIIRRFHADGILMVGAYGWAFINRLIWKRVVSQTLEVRDARLHPDSCSPPTCPQ
jgi:hypothetical protein